ncbi:MULTISPECIES: GIY-YIG nuclease family protein [unclassified Bradyrhizobium]|uniref:GIY-YIG nuclease family protein n=1 Tax=unclassified Bradyrhizobium TaxID=2631580 RepID=UPI0028F108FC|nr:MULTISPECIES: GIY-YIG nuclease family protein [unclassified Bradyrhizobium]
MTEPNTEPARAAVGTYCRRYAINPPFEFSALYPLTAENWTNTIPFHLEPGCYFFYADDGSLLYVGKASSGLASRIIKYFQTRPSFAIRHTDWIKPPAVLQTLKVHFAYEASSLEEYLIQELRPLQNRLGVPPAVEDT